MTPVALLLVLLAGFINTGQGQDFFVRYICDKDQKLTFKAYGVAGKAVKKVVVQGKEGTCATGATSTSTPPVPVVAFTAGTGLIAAPTTGTINPTPADEGACGYAATNNIRTVTLFLMTSVHILQGSDGKTTITCSSTTASTTERDAPVVTVTGDPSESTDTDLDITLEVKVLKADPAPNLETDNSVTTAVLGENYFIVGVLTTTTVVKKFKFGKCTASPSSDSNTKREITTANGCPSLVHDVYATENGNQAESTGTNTYIVRLPDFKIFYILGFTDLKISCTLSVCTDGDTRCDLDKQCPTNSRRKRDIGSNNRNTTRTATLFILTHGPANEKNKLHQQDLTVSSCLSHVSFISVVAILAVLLVVSLAVSVFFCSKLIRRNNNNQQKEAYPNPAYKA